MKKLLFFVLTALLTACSSRSDTTFLDFFQVTTVLPQASFDFASPYKDQPLQVRIGWDGRIFGTGNGKRFYTDDFFQTLYTATGFASYGYYEIDGHYVHRTKYDDDTNTLVIEESADFAKTFAPKVTLENVSDDDFVYHAESRDKAWLLLKKFNQAEVILINGSSYTTMSTIPALENLVSIWVEGNEGVIAVDDDFFGNVVNIYRSTDGGSTWLYSSTLEQEKDNSNTHYDVTHVKAHGNLLYAYADAAPYNGFTSNQSDYVYLSRNNGGTWEFFRQNNLRAFQFIDETTGYAIRSLNFVYNWEDDELASTGYLYKTTDGGHSWTQVSNQVIYADRIFFLDEHIGLAMSYSILQVTTDGGESWNLLLYPIDEEE